MAKLGSALMAVSILLHGFTVYAVNAFIASQHMDAPPRPQIAVEPLMQARSLALLALALGIIGLALLLIGWLRKSVRIDTA